MLSYTLTIITPEGTAYKGEVESITVPGEEGYFGVLANHAPMVTATKLGPMTIKDTEGRETFFVIGNGVVEVSKGQVVVLVGQAKPAESYEDALADQEEAEPVF